MLTRLFYLLFFTLPLCCCADEALEDFNDWQENVLTHFTSGSNALLSNQPSTALTCFQQAGSALNLQDPASFSLSFLISFCNAIAYDMLQEQESCERAIGSLVLKMNQEDLDTTSLSEEPFNFSISPPEKESLEFLRQLITLAPSNCVRQSLFSLIDRIEGELTSDFEQAGFSSKNHKSNMNRIIPCKSVWKKIRKWLGEVIKFIDLVVKTLKKVNEFRNEYEEFEDGRWRRNRNHLDTNPYTEMPTKRLHV